MAIIQRNPVYEPMDLDEFLHYSLNAHEDVEDLLKKIVNGSSPEWVAFHHKSIAAHTGLVHIRQRDKVWQLHRRSSIRGTAAYEQYVYQIYDVTEGEVDFQNIAYRKFFRKWDDWITVRIGKDY